MAWGVSVSAVMAFSSWANAGGLRVRGSGRAGAPSQASHYTPRGYEGESPECGSLRPNRRGGNGRGGEGGPVRG
ncbi:hypothetical protein GCM10010447_10040 [Streptomyces fulvorobeus]